MMQGVAACTRSLSNSQGAGCRETACWLQESLPTGGMLAGVAAARFPFLVTFAANCVFLRRIAAAVRVIQPPQTSDAPVAPVLSTEKSVRASGKSSHWPSLSPKGCFGSGRFVSARSARTRTSLELFKRVRGNFCAMRKNEAR